MKIITSTLRAVIERVTEIEINLYGENNRLYVFENLDERGVACHYWVQNWECDDITDTLDYIDHKEIKNALYEHYKSASNSKE
jgi:hypothetical protein